jgi:hypothetical protein
LFYYGLDASDYYSSRTMMGAGILSLSIGGKHQTEMAKRAGDWVLAHRSLDTPSEWVEEGIASFAALIIAVKALPS